MLACLVNSWQQRDVCTSINSRLHHLHCNHATWCSHLAGLASKNHSHGDVNGLKYRALIQKNPFSVFSSHTEQADKAPSKLGDMDLPHSPFPHLLAFLAPREFAPSADCPAKMKPLKTDNSRSTYHPHIRSIKILQPCSTNIATAKLSGFFYFLDGSSTRPS